MGRAFTRYAIAWLAGLLILHSGSYQANQARQQVKQMTAEDILNRLASALGGTEKLRQVENIYLRGSIEIAGLSGTIQEWQTATGQYKQILDLGAAYQNTIILDGNHGWVVDRNNQVSDLAGVSLEEQILSSYLGSFSHLIPGRLPGSVTASGEDASGKYYVLQIRPQGGRGVSYYVDKSTFLPIKMEMPKKDGIVTTYFEDWREVSGIKVPYRYRQTERDTRNNALIKEEEVGANTAIAVNTFDRPRALARDFRFTGGRTSQRIPFDYTGKSIYLRGSINNSAPAWFLLDTGTGVSVIEERLARTLGLKFEGKIGVSATGGNTELSFTKGVSFTFPGVQLLNQRVAAMPFGPEITQIKPNFGGILGYDFISRFVVEINYLDKTITLYDPQLYSYKGSGHRVHISVEGTPFVEAEVRVKGQEPVKGQFELDTGHDGAVTLYRPFVKAHKGLEPVGKVTEGSMRGLGNETKNLTAYIEGFSFGGLSFQNVITNYPQAEEGSGGSSDVAGLIGNEILRRFNVILDYSRQEMILEPNTHFSDTFEGSLSGIELEIVGSHRNVFTVADVTEQSEAEKAGVRAGDVLVAIDSKPASTFSLSQIEQLLQLQGREYLLTFKRGKELFQARIKNKTLN
jgi:hypothetical protein